MATSTAPHPAPAGERLTSGFEVAAPDAVTQRRIQAALAGAYPPGADAGAPVVVLAADLGDPETASIVRAACESSRGAGVVVVSPPGSDSQVRRVLRAGAFGIVFEGQLERTLAAAVRAVAAGFVVVPQSRRHQVIQAVFSHREREILRLVAAGATNREIADRLFLAESTVKSHLSTAFTKLGVRTRAEATALVLDPAAGPLHGLMTTTDAARDGSPVTATSERGTI